MVVSGKGEGVTEGEGEGEGKGEGEGEGEGMGRGMVTCLVYSKLAEVVKIKEAQRIRRRGKRKETAMFFGEGV